jgi:hypothetical protein
MRKFLLILACVSMAASAHAGSSSGSTTISMKAFANFARANPTSAKKLEASQKQKAEATPMNSIQTDQVDQRSREK